MSEVQLREYPWQVGLRFFQGVAQIVFLLVLARYLSPEDFGLFAVVTIFTTVSGILVEFGMGSALVQKDSVQNEQFSSVFWAVFFSSLLVSAIICLSAGYIGSWFALPSFATLIRIAIWVVPLVALQIVPRALISRRFDFRVFARIDAFGTAIGVAVAFVVLSYSASVWVFVVQNILTSLIRTVWLWMSVEWRPSFRFRLRDTSGLIRFGKHVASFNSLNFVSKYFDDAIVGKMLGAFALGMYNFSYRIITFQQEIISGVMNQMALSVYARLQTSKEKVFAMFCRDTQFITVLSLPLLAFIFVVAPLFVPLVIGDRWLPAIPVMQILVLEAMRQSLLSLAGSAMLSIGDSHRFMLYAIVAAPVLVISFLLGVHWGIVGVAASLFIFNSLLMFLLLFLLHRSFLLSLKPIFWQWVPGIAISCGVYCGVSPIVTIAERSHRPVAWAIATVLVAGFLVFLLLRGLFPTAYRLTRNIVQSFRMFDFSHSRDSVVRQKEVVYVDPLSNDWNPHLTALHAAIGREYPNIAMRELNFRNFVIQLPRLLFERRAERKTDRELSTHILHFHFVHRVYNSKSAFVSFFKAVRFLLGIVLCRFCGIKVVWTCHNERAHDFAHRKVEKFFLASLAILSDEIISLSLKGKELLWHAYGRSEEVWFTPHPHYRGMYPDSVTVDLARRKLGIRRNEVMFLFFGKVFLYKGVSELVEIFRRWKPGVPVRLFIVGEFCDAKLENEIRDNASDDERITIVNRHIPEDETQLYLRSADFGVLPFREILHSGTAMLFSSFECPIIVPDLGWFPEIFERHRIGIMYDHLSSDGLKNALESSLTRTRAEFRQAIGQFCDETTLQQAVESTAKVYERCVFEG
ncbi:MAG TPA: oligosaccharide flippase family protein [Bacteroidota bacterium]|nr:oligosaccharide flippase family protein [Bacteroidota bacterium]